MIVEELQRNIGGDRRGVRGTEGVEKTGEETTGRWGIGNGRHARATDRQTDSITSYAPPFHLLPAFPSPFLNPILLLCSNAPFVFQSVTYGNTLRFGFVYNERI